MSRTLRIVLATFPLLLFPLAAITARAADCNGNGLEDFDDLAAGRSPDCNADGVPDECDVLPVNYTLGARTTIEEVGDSVVAADLDGDGARDLAVAQFRGTLLLLWNDGAGNFSAGRVQRFLVGRNPVFLVAEDLDGDGDLDLITAEQGGFTVTLNAGGRAFTPEDQVRTGDDHTELAAADLDADGDSDVILAGSFALEVYLNDGRGALARRERIRIGSDPRSVTAADLDGDGAPDLVTGNDLANISLLLNDGAGGLAPPVNLAAGVSAFVEAADLDGDGDVDLAVTGGRARIAVLLNGGGLAFDRVEYAAGLEPARIAAADLDGDGDRDLVVASGDSGAGVFMNHGNGHFASMVSPGVGRGRSLAAGDLDGDGVPEVAAVHPGLPILSVLERRSAAYSLDCNRNGAPDECELDDGDCNANGIPDDCDLAAGTSADCNGNALPDECDLAAAAIGDCDRNRVPDDCDLASGRHRDCNGNGVPDGCDVAADHAFSPVAATDLRFAGLLAPIAAEDFDGDGDLDVLTVDGDGLALFRNRAGAFTPEAVVVNTPPAAVAPGDLDGDGDVDLAAVGYRQGWWLFLLLNDRNEFSERAVDGPAGRRTPSSPALGDLDGDGDLDLAAVDLSGARVVVHTNGGGAAFGGPIVLESGDQPFAVGATDVDGDGLDDLLALDRASRSLAVLRSAGGGSFEAARRTDLGIHPGALAAGDLDGDGATDVAVVGWSDRDLIATVFLNGGEGSFALAARHWLSAIGTIGDAFPRIADLDRDGDADLMVAWGVFGMPSRPTAHLTVLANAGGGTLAGVRDLSVGEALPIAFDAGDLDGDGDIDAVYAGAVGPDCDDCLVPAAADPAVRPFPERVSLFFAFNETELPPPADRNRDHVPDECDDRSFHRGDADGDGRLDLADGLFVLEHLFRGGRPPACRESADDGNDGRIDLSDPVFTLNHLFLGGPQPAAPGPPGLPCGLDPDPPGTAGDLGCEEYPPCAVPSP